MLTVPSWVDTIMPRVLAVLRPVVVSMSAFSQCRLASELSDGKNPSAVAYTVIFIQSVLPIYPYDMVFFHSLFYEVIFEKGEQQV